jgi:hypothetical protein
MTMIVNVASRVFVHEVHSNVTRELGVIVPYFTTAMAEWRLDLHARWRSSHHSGVGRGDKHGEMAHASDASSHVRQ